VEEELRRLFQSYTAAKQRQNVLDYDDLLLYWAEMMRDDNLAAEIGGRFDLILVDEYQDTNRLQSNILLRLKPDGLGLMVVGDDAQSIYSFRAATVRNILDFPNQFRPAAAIVTLEQNYRSTQPILDACNQVIRFAKERYTKNLRSGRPSKQKPFLTTVVVGSGACRTLARETSWCQCEGSHRKQATPKNEKGHGRRCRGCGRDRGGRRYPRAELSAGKGCPVWHANRGIPGEHGGWRADQLRVRPHGVAARSNRPDIGARSNHPDIAPEVAWLIHGHAASPVVIPTATAAIRSFRDC
jgi:UvrD/REP helicase N-terminal domain